MADIILSSLNKPSISVNGKKETNHANLKNLSFEESGHTGFQSELTQEQIKNIADVVRKEDKANKVTKIGGESTDEMYPSARAVYDYVIYENKFLAESAILPLDMRIRDAENTVASILKKTDILEAQTESCGDWELLKSGTLTEDVGQLSWSNFPKSKELYIYFRVPTLNPDNAITSFDKARILLYGANNTLIENCIYYEQSPSFTDTGKTWRVGYHVRMYGTICTTERMYDVSMNSAEKMYNLAYNLYYSKAFGKKFDNPYIEQLTALMYPSGTRYFPIGTEYEIWGVKA